MNITKIQIQKIKTANLESKMIPIALLSIQSHFEDSIFSDSKLAEAASLLLKKTICISDISVFNKEKRIKILKMAQEQNKLQFSKSDVCLILHDYVPSLLEQ